MNTHNNKYKSRKFGKRKADISKASSGNNSTSVQIPVSDNTSNKDITTSSPINVDKLIEDSNTITSSANIAGNSSNLNNFKHKSNKSMKKTKFPNRNKKRNISKSHDASTHTKGSHNSSSDNTKDVDSIPSIASVNDNGISNFDEQIEVIDSSIRYSPIGEWEESSITGSIFNNTNVLSGITSTEKLDRYINDINRVLNSSRLTKFNLRKKLNGVYRHMGWFEPDDLVRHYNDFTYSRVSNSYPFEFRGILTPHVIEQMITANVSGFSPYINSPYHYTLSSDGLSYNSNANVVNSDYHTFALDMSNELQKDSYFTSTTRPHADAFSFSKRPQNDNYKLYTSKVVNSAVKHEKLPREIAIDEATIRFEESVSNVQKNVLSISSDLHSGIYSFIHNPQLIARLLFDIIPFGNFIQILIRSIHKALSISPSFLQKTGTILGVTAPFINANAAIKKGIDNVFQYLKEVGDVFPYSKYVVDSVMDYLDPYLSNPSKDMLDEHNPIIAPSAVIAFVKDSQAVTTIPLKAHASVGQINIQLGNILDEFLKKIKTVDAQFAVDLDEDKYLELIKKEIKNGDTYIKPSSNQYIYNRVTSTIRAALVSSSYITPFMFDVIYTLLKQPYEIMSLIDDSIYKLSPILRVFKGNNVYEGSDFVIGNTPLISLLGNFEEAKFGTSKLALFESPVIANDEFTFPLINEEHISDYEKTPSQLILIDEKENNVRVQNIVKCLFVDKVVSGNKEYKAVVPWTSIFHPLFNKDVAIEAGHVGWVNEGERLAFTNLRDDYYQFVPTSFLWFPLTSRSRSKWTLDQDFILPFNKIDGTNPKLLTGIACSNLNWFFGIRDMYKIRSHLYDFMSVKLLGTNWIARDTNLNNSFNPNCRLYVDKIDLPSHSFVTYTYNTNLLSDKTGIVTRHVHRTRKVEKKPS